MSWKMLTHNLMAYFKEDLTIKLNEWMLLNLILPHIFFSRLDSYEGSAKQSSIPLTHTVDCCWTCTKDWMNQINSIVLSSAKAKFSNIFLSKNRHNIACKILIRIFMNFVTSQGNPQNEWMNCWNGMTHFKCVWFYWRNYLT